MSRRGVLPLLVLLLACSGEQEPARPPGGAPAPAASPLPSPASRTLRVDSNVFHVDSIWKSMQGPFQIKPFSMAPSPTPELMWLTGYRARIVDADGLPGVSQEFMCHNNLDLDVQAPQVHKEIFDWDPTRVASTSYRLFTLSQGQFDVTLPPGFGVPIRSDERLFLSTQVLNHNVEDADVRVRHAVQIDATRDQDLERPLKPLYQSAVSVLASLEDTEAYFGVDDPEAVHQGASCAVGMTPGGVNEGLSLYRDPFGRRFTGHWVVPPGREERHTLVTEQLKLTFDTRIHFIGAHLHPFAETLELRDLTSGETLYTVRATQPEEGVGLADVTWFSSAEGIPVYRDHEYELISVYDNTSGVDQDAMATLFLYLYDEDAARAIAAMRR